ncbi:hypothetical protein Vqi01_02260 [Micromonospora qiuiae]|uniref:Response regulatory domain-containing protein n=1 Tax=Micromonospora qiuiae TaxID=502268 RepID=A0ABQ4J4I8_9ACTN|nr:hypothetical protein Vqi01_02260 [Micromonospora qiuiae]
MIRVLPADDEELIRTALAALLYLEQDLTVVAQAADGDAAVTAALAHRPDVAVVDLAMPRRDGFQVAAELARVAGLCGGHPHRPGASAASGPRVDRRGLGIPAQRSAGWRAGRRRPPGAHRWPVRRPGARGGCTDHPAVRADPA